MHDRKVIIISSFVPAHNQSPVAVNKKMLQLCSDIFDEVTFITANFPGNELDTPLLKKVQLYNLPADFSKASSLWLILNYIKMQIASIRVLKTTITKKSLVLFWLSGPMIIPFLYCKLKGAHIIAFLYGNSKYKSNRYNPINLLKSYLMHFMALHADIACVEAPGVLTQWGYQTNDSRFQTIHLFADTKTFCETTPPAQRQPVIGMCCRLVSNKRVLESIEAFATLHKRYPQYHLEIVGSGPLEDSCRKCITELQLQDCVELVGWVSSGELPQYYNRWRAMLHPTNYEGLPNSVIEAMCCSTPVLSSAVGGVVDVIEDGITGWYLSECTPEVIAKKLEEIIKSDQWIQIARNAGKFAQQEYCYDAALKTLHDVCRKIK